MEAISPLSLVATLAYVLTAMAALTAAFRPDRARGRMVTINWTGVAVIFLVLAAWRYTDGEAVLQDQAREWTRNHGVYDDRHTWQVPITLAAVAAIIALGLVAIRWSGVRQSGRALCAAVVMLAFTAVRAVSLHAVDDVLYQSFGPVHVNYLVDLGLTAIVAVLALIDCGLFGAAEPAPVKRQSSSRNRRSGHSDRERRNSDRRDSDDRDSDQRDSVARDPDARGRRRRRRTK